MVMEARVKLAGFLLLGSPPAHRTPVRWNLRKLLTVARAGAVLSALIVAAVAVSAQSSAPPPAASGFEHGHRLGTSVAYLKESGDVRDGTPFSGSLPDGAGQARTWALIIRAAELQNPSGSGVRVLITPNATAAYIPALGSSMEPCAAFETWAEQRTSDFAESTQTGVTGVDRTEGTAVIHRFVRDDLRQIYASYTVTVETLPEEGTYRVSFGPPTGDLPAQVSGKADWKTFSPARFPVPQIVKDEDSIRLELYSNGSSRRVVDYIHAGRWDRMVMRKETPHDYYADDAEFGIAQPRVRVNGVVLDGLAVLPETIRGPVLWIYVPGYGRYVLTPHAHPELGVESAGEAAGNSLTFTSADGNVFRIDTADRIAAGSGSYSVHVFADSSWEPADPLDRGRMMIGAAPGVAGAP